MLNLKNDIKNRTFGVEIEMCNLDKSKVTLPQGYKWSEEEEIVNTDGSSNKKIGGEVNTPPLHICSINDLHGLRSVYKSMKDAGGVIKWTTYTHVHIYAGDLSVEQLKKIWLFFYVCYPFFKKYTKLSDWDELAFNCQPLPERKYYDRLLQANEFKQIEDIFSNQSKKGFIRHAVNISAYFKTKTVEYRTYHGTDNFYESLNCILSTYRFFYYAINHELDDFYNINSYEEILQEANLKYQVPDEKIPLLYQGNPYSAIETFQTKSLSYCSMYASVLHNALDNHKQKEICVVNGFMYYYELYFADKYNVSIYAQDPYCHMLYLIANGKITIKYDKKLLWLQDYNNDTPIRQLALTLYASKLQKVLMTESARNDAIIESLKSKAKESIEKTEKSCEKLFKLLTTCEYKIGTLQDAIKEKKVIFFNYGYNKVQKRSFNLIKKNSNYDIELDIKRNDYYEVVESLPESTYFYYFSNSPYLRNMHKIAIFNSSNGTRRSAGTFLYSNKCSEQNKANTYYENEIIETNEIIPPDDLVIDNPNKLKIEIIDRNYLYQLQRKYIKKVDMCSHCTFAFVVMYDKYTIGGFGFDLPKHNGFDLFQLNDFCTNNAIPRLSKLILYCIQSKGVQKVLSRRMKKMCENVISLAYTHKPVSMKYRGPYKKIEHLSTKSYLAYEGKLGIYNTNKEIIEKFLNTLKNGK